MEGVEVDGGDAVQSPLAKWKNEVSRTFRYYLDRSAPYTFCGWLGTLAAALIYILRVYYGRGFYVISYGVGTYILNLLIGFLSPKEDPELEALDGASLLPKDNDEFRPLFAACLSFCSVFWPILLCYWIFLLVLTMKRQITRMIRYKYDPFRKKKYSGSKSD